MSRNHKNHKEKMLKILGNLVSNDPAYTFAAKEKARRKNKNTRKQYR